MGPQGGTELQLKELVKRVSRGYWKRITLVTSVPEKKPLHRNKINILWQKNNYDQPNIYPWFRNKDNHTKYDWYVFNSHWNYEKFRMLFDIPTERCIVIKNALPDVKWKEKNFYKEGTLKLVYCSTPWRGLNVLLAAMNILKEEDIELHLYSSTQIYGDQFNEKNKSIYTPLFDQADTLKNVHNHGYIDNQNLISKMEDTHVFAHPSIWEETSCISAIEAMAAGNAALVTNFGALFETCTDFGYYINYDKDPTRLSQNFASGIKELKKNLASKFYKQRLRGQMNYYRHYYAWKLRAKEWTAFFENALKKKGIE